MENKIEITDILAREILDSRGNPTVEVEVEVEVGAEDREQEQTSLKQV